jgi:putative ABC transport system permease protein
VQWIRRMAMLFRRRRFERELEEELRFHAEARERALADAGLDAPDARDRARRDVGSPLQLRERAGDVWRLRWLDALTQDVRFALRSMRRSPTFTLAVIGTFAIGIGAATAIFTLVDRLLLRPLPYRDPAALVLITAAKPDAGQPRIPLSYPNFVDTRSRVRSLSGLAGWTLATVNLVGAGEPEELQYGLTTANLFDVLGVSPMLGRTFRASEDRPGSAPVVMLGYGLWQRRFGSDPSIVGRSIQLEDRAFEVIGVLPAGFEFASFPARTEIWIPFGNDPAPWRPFARGANGVSAVGRLGPGITLARAQAELDSVAAALAAEEPSFNRGRSMRAARLADQASASVRGALLVLAASVGLLLLMACVNVVNLLLARSASRQHELAVRAALGAGRRRLSMQLLVEHLVLALAGGLAGAGLAAAAVRALAGLPYHAADLFTPYVTPLDDLAVDPRVLGFSLVLTVVTGLLVGVGPAMRETGPLAAGDLITGGRASVARRTVRLRSLLVACETALAVVLLVAMSAMLASLVRLERTSTGFEPAGLVTADLRLPPSTYAQDHQVRAFFDTLLTRLRATPGITHAAAGEAVPFAGTDQSTSFFVEGRQPPPPDRRTHVHHRVVSDGYFETLGVRLVDGRLLDARDTERAGRVAVVNETLARQVFPGEPAIGKRLAIDLEAMRFHRDRPPDLDVAGALREIVGVVADVRGADPGEPSGPELYIPSSQRSVRTHTIVVRGPGDPLALIAAMRTAVSGVDAQQPLTHVAVMEGRVAASLARPRFDAGLLAAFGLIALILAAVGIYGVTAYAVAQRTRDFGVHVALGATPRHVLRLVAAQLLGLVCLGLVVGAIGGWTGVRMLRSTISHVDAASPFTVLMVALAVLAVAAIAGFVPARRAIRIDPVVALRAE